MTFQEWWNSNDDPDAPYIGSFGLAEAAFKAGQQTKQDRILELINNHSEKLYDLVERKWRLTSNNDEQGHAKITTCESLIQIIKNDAERHNYLLTSPPRA